MLHFKCEWRDYMLSHEGVHNAQQVDKIDRWWNRVYELTCNTEDRKNEFESLGISIWDYRSKVLKESKYSIEHLQKAIENNNVKSLIDVMENMFLEPVNQQDINVFLNTYHKGMKVEDFWEYRNNHMGMRFVSVVKHFM
jgi:hypothetical protein